MSETVRETLERVMTNMGFYDNKNNSNNLQAYNQETLNKAANNGSWAVTPQPTYESLILNHQNYDNQLNSDWNGVATSAVTGSVEGLWGGINRAANVATLGLYGKGIDMLMGNAYSNLQNRLQQQAEQAGLGDFNEVANNAIDAGIGIRFGRKLL